MKTTITLRMSELIYDIQNKTYLTGRSRADSVSREQVANIQANDDEENSNQLRRSIGAALGVVATRLADYLDGSIGEADNLLADDDSDVELHLEVPSNFNMAMGRSVAEAAHGFVVASAVADWFVITNKGDASDYRAEAERQLSQLVHSVTRRVRPQRGTLRPLPPM